MNKKSYKLLHYVLIILLMLTPMRGVLASPLPHCNMADMQMSDMQMSGMEESGMDMHVTAQAVSKQMPQVVTNKQAATHDKCCCCDGNSCAGNCDMGMAVSMLMQASIYTPVFIRTASFVLSSSDVLARALTPPSRPPAKFS